MIDSHTHLFIEQTDEEGNSAVEIAEKEGVKQFLLPNIDLESVKDLHDVCDNNPNSCFPMMGLHPCSVENNWKEVLKQMRALFNERNYVGVGEIGLDLYWDKSNFNNQIEAFKAQVDWAKELNLPVAIHVREAFDEIFEVMNEVNDERLKGVFHCFTGTMNHAKKIIDLGGFYMGIGGVLTFKNAGLDKVIKDVPLAYLMLETDTPYLAPSPHRGKKNQSKYLPIIAKKLAEVKDVSFEEIVNTTTANTKNLFQLV